MTEQSWTPLFRTATSTITKVLRSPAFLHARERAAVTIDSAAELRTLADATERLDHVNAPLSAVADRVGPKITIKPRYEAFTEFWKGYQS